MKTIHLYSIKVRNVKTFYFYIIYTNCVRRSLYLSFEVVHKIYLPHPKEKDPISNIDTLKVKWQ